MEVEFKEGKYALYNLIGVAFSFAQFLWAPW